MTVQQPAYVLLTTKPPMGATSVSFMGYVSSPRVAAWSFYINTGAGNQAMHGVEDHAVFTAHLAHSPHLLLLSSSITLAVPFLDQCNHVFVGTTSTPKGGQAYVQLFVKSRSQSVSHTTPHCLSDYRRTGKSLYPPATLGGKPQASGSMNLTVRL